MNSKDHWEKVYSTKLPNEVSWTEESPVSLKFIKGLQLDKNASIIDVGGGDSILVDCLLNEGYGNITVLDISEHAIERAKKRLREKAVKVKWIISNILDFEPAETYDLWHDRATFHFLTQANEVTKYIKIASSAIAGNLILGTFSESGPEKCSGLVIKQYNEDQMQSLLGEYFDKLQCRNVTHKTPFNTPQEFLFCSFKRR